MWQAIYSRSDQADRRCTRRRPNEGGRRGAGSASKPGRRRHRTALRQRGELPARPCPGRGIRVWGARRTLSDDPGWQSIAAAAGVPHHGPLAGAGFLAQLAYEPQRRPACGCAIHGASWTAYLDGPVSSTAPSKGPPPPRGSLLRQVRQREPTRPRSPERGDGGDQRRRGAHRSQAEFIVGPHHPRHQRPSASNQFRHLPKELPTMGRPARIPISGYNFAVELERPVTRAGIP